MVLPQSLLKIAFLFLAINQASVHLRFVQLLSLASILVSTQEMSWLLVFACSDIAELSVFANLTLAMCSFCLGGLLYIE